MGKRTYKRKKSLKSGQNNYDKPTVWLFIEKALAINELCQILTGHDLASLIKAFIGFIGR